MSATLRPTDFAGFLSQSETAQLVRAVEDHYTPYGAIPNNKGWRFAELESPDQLDLDYETTTLPPKHVFRPPDEKLFSFSGGEIEERAETDAKPAALIGIHPCDAQAISILDEVFEDRHDTYYHQKRDDALVIVRTCDTPGKSCFCNLTDTGPFGVEGADIVLVPTGNGHLVASQTAKGRAVVAQLDLEAADEDRVEKAQELLDSATATLEEQNGDLAEAFLTVDEALKLMSHPDWEDIAEDCIGCGACTTVCPTCFCYDVVDESSLDNSQVDRVRRWDSCLYLRFSEMAAHPDEPELESRLRQRLFHKWAFHNEQFGTTGCVGCGRCIDACAANIDPRELLKRLRRETDDVA
jgi:ferredoxin